MARDGAREFEIKLFGAPADVAAAQRSPLLEALRIGAGAWERLVTTYYDTPHAHLEAEGITLRLREEAGGLIQALKSETPGEGALARIEEERPLASRAEFPAGLPNGAAGLAPVSRTAADRWTVLVGKGGTRIEAAFDFGRIEVFANGAAARSQPLAECELELVAGSPGRLFDLARRLVEESGGRLRPLVASKAEQARRLASGDPIGREADIAIDPAADAGAAFAAALRRSAARIIDLGPAVCELRMPEAVHQLRVALRRFRVIERLFRPAIASERLATLARRAGEIALALGPARDWDVFLDATLPRIAASAAGRLSFADLEARAAALRAEAWSAAAAAAEAPEFALFALDLLEAGHVEKWRKGAGPALSMPIRAFAAAALDRRRARSLQIAGRLPPHELAAWHRLRIALKKLRYAAQAFRGLYERERRKPFMSAMARIQNDLGALNDALVAQALANRAAQGQGSATQRGSGFVCGVMAAEAHAAAAAIEASWAEFAALAPFWRENEETRHAEGEGHSLP